MLQERLIDIENRIDAACTRAGRSKQDVAIIAVTKTLPPDVINTAIDAGLTRMGENRVQEYLRKREALNPHEFHLIGHLQRNKVKSILPYCALIHSVDSVQLAEEIHKASEQLDRHTEILLEINTSGERTKNGVRPEDALAAARAVQHFSRVHMTGLMTVAEFVENSEDARPNFRLLRSILDELKNAFPSADFRHLSMGMTNDFEVAIEEGATLIRLGTALFGRRMM